MAATVAIKLGAKAAVKIAKFTRNPKVRKGTKLIVKFVKGRPRARAQKIEKESLRGPSPVAETLSIWAFEKVTRPVLAKMRFPIPSSKDAATDIVRNLEKGEFDLEGPTLATLVIGGGAVRDQIIFEASKMATGPSQTALKVTLFLL